jgi:glutaredoxin-related protein
MAKIILYTTHCPKCEILKKKLTQKDIQFEEVTDMEVMMAKGFMAAPMLEVDGEVMDFAKANEWANQQ